jgi:hypothetical protein
VVIRMMLIGSLSVDIRDVHPIMQFYRPVLYRSIREESIEQYAWMIAGFSESDGWKGEMRLMWFSSSGAVKALARRTTMRDWPNQMTWYGRYHVNRRKPQGLVNRGGLHIYRLIA